jgi:hypothetical protein
MDALRMALGAGDRLSDAGQHVMFAMLKNNFIFSCA